MRCQCTATPRGFMNKAAMRSEEIAAEGVTPKIRTSIGVIKAPPPMPVSPTRKPTTMLPMMRVQVHVKYQTDWPGEVDRPKELLVK